MGLMDDIKNQVKRSGSSKVKLVYFRSGLKVRIRFLTEMDAGMKILFHDSFASGVNVPCQELFGKVCTHHEDEELRHRDMFVWSVWDYEAKEVKLVLAPVNNCSPIPALVGMYDTYGTIIDRDYIITKSGQQTSTTFAVVPMDKVKFKNDKAKPFSTSKILSIIDKAYPSDDEEDAEEIEDDEDVETLPRHKATSTSKAKPVAKSSKKVEDDDDEDDEEDEIDYDEMSAKELYQLCIKREIKATPRKDASFYTKKLQQYDEERDEEEGEDDVW